MEIYLDNSATTKPYAEVVEEMVKALTTEYGNPSSLHKKGIEVDRKIKEIRQNIARTLGVKDKPKALPILETSGYKRGDNTIGGLALKELLLLAKKVAKLVAFTSKMR